MTSRLNCGTERVPFVRGCRVLFQLHRSYRIGRLRILLHHALWTAQYRHLQCQRPTWTIWVEGRDVAGQPHFKPYLEDVLILGDDYLGIALDWEISKWASVIVAAQTKTVWSREICNFKISFISRMASGRSLMQFAFRPASVSHCIMDNRRFDVVFTMDDLISFIFHLTRPFM